MKDRALVRLEKVSRVYTVGQVPLTVLDGVQLDVLRGELLAIVGPSGSGKTTLLNLIGGLDQPTEGRIWFEEESLELSRVDAGRLTEYRRRHVGFVFQFYNLVPSLTAEENVQAAAELVEHPRDVQQMLERVGLWERRHHFPAELSGGEQQRVALARALVKNPTLLLCDEPTGALDLATARRVLRLLVDLHRELQQTVVIITHNTALCGIAERVVHISSGKIRDIQQNCSPIAPEEVVW
ncbi:MAG: ABC transporter [Pirellulaceae bacterium]|nr:MAG: ABC transporter [Pirellulaceae bacterium]